jgi:hypothetical protein
MFQPILNFLFRGAISGLYHAPPWQFSKAFLTVIDISELGSQISIPFFLENPTRKSQQQYICPFHMK